MVVLESKPGKHHCPLCEKLSLVTGIDCL
jgi:hypothetical protein